MFVSLTRAGTRGGREGLLPWVQWFTVGMGASFFCCKAERISDRVIFALGAG